MPLFENHVRTTRVASKRGLAGSASGTTARRTRYGTRSVPTDSIDGDDFCAAGNRYDIVVLEGGQKYAFENTPTRLRLLSGNKYVISNTCGNSELALFT